MNFVISWLQSLQSLLPPGYHCAESIARSPAFDFKEILITFSYAHTEVLGSNTLSGIYVNTVYNMFILLEVQEGFRDLYLK